MEGLRGVGEGGGRRGGGGARKRGRREDGMGREEGGGVSYVTFAKLLARPYIGTTGKW